MDIFTPDKRSQIMSRIGNKNTKPELKLRRALYALGLRYRLHAGDLMGRPDIVFRARRVVVFVDGDWWHGKNYQIEHHKYTEKWQNKIATNMKRDSLVTSTLRNEGWRVLRFWQSDIEKRPIECAVKVAKAIKELPSGHLKP